MWFSKGFHSEIKCEETQTVYEKQWRKDCRDSALTSSSSLLNNPVIIPCRVGLEFSLKKQQQKIIIHSDVPVFKEESKKFSLSLPLWTHPATSIYKTVEVTHKTNQTNLSDLKPPRLMGNRDKTEPCLFVIVCLLFAKTRHTVDLLAVYVVIGWHFIVRVLISKSLTRQFALPSPFQTSNVLILSLSCFKQTDQVAGFACSNQPQHLLHPADLCSREVCSHSSHPTNLIFFRLVV